MKRILTYVTLSVLALFLIGAGTFYVWQSNQGHPEYLKENTLQEGEINWLDEEGRRLSSEEHAVYKVTDWQEVEGGYYIVLHHSNGTPAVKIYQTGLDLTTSKNFGDYHTYNEQGWLEESGTYNDEGEIEGIVTGYYEDGSKRLEVNFFNSEPHGHFQSYYTDGQLASEGNYEHGQLQGLVDFWSEDGQLDKRKRYKDEQLIEERVYNDDELSRLTIREENEHGEIWREERYRNDGSLRRRKRVNIDETWELRERFDEEGELNFREEHLNGQTVGLHLETGYGEILKEGHYINGELHGEYKRIASDGTICMLTTYQHGQKHGPHYQCDGNGALREQGEFRDDHRVGEWRFYRNGQLSRLEAYDEEGEQHGTQYHFLSHGELRNIVEFDHGVKHGNSWYFEHGIPHTRSRYRYGTRTSQEQAKEIPRQEWP